MTDQKMTNQILRDTVDLLNEITGNQHIVNSWEISGSQKYGLLRQDKKGNIIHILEPDYTKREIYYHIQGFIKISGKTTNSVGNNTEKEG